MKKVWKCDYCNHTQEEVKGMTKHEDECAFNPINKTCYTCKNKWHRWGNEGCDIDMSIVDGEDDGNCKGHETKL